MVLCVRVREQLERACLYVRVDVVQQRLTDHAEVPRLHGVMGYVQDEEIDRGLGRSQLGGGGGGLAGSST